MSMAMVQLMLPGLAFFYAGLLHRRSVVTMIMQNFAAMGVIFVLWFLFVFSLCFGDTWVFVGSILSYPCFINVDGEPLKSPNGVEPLVADIPGLVFAAYQGARRPCMSHLYSAFQCPLALAILAPICRRPLLTRHVRSHHAGSHDGCVC